MSLYHQEYQYMRVVSEATTSWALTNKSTGTGLY